MPLAPTLDLYRLLADTTYDWETWVDAEGAACWVNPAVERITGYTVAECLRFGDYPLPLAHADDRTLVSLVLADAARGGSGNDVEFRVVQKGGSVRWVAISWQAVLTDQGTRMGYRTSVRDIDDRKRVEQELHEMRRRAEAFATARAELLANVSHELRSPAHCIAGFADLLLASELSPPQHRQVQLIADQCAIMMHQVEDLLELAAFEAGGVRLSNQPFDLRAFLAELLETTQPRADARGLTLHVELSEAPRWVEGDPHRVRQVLQNLLDNALKFTERGRVNLTVCRRHEDDSVELTVEDTGVGMAPGDIARLLEPFQQGDASTTRKHGGTGLGLAICQRLVHAMGGALHIDSELGLGTRVHVRLPLPSTQSHRRDSRPEPLSRTLPVGHALIVDDSAPARELLRGMLALFGWTANEAASGRAALTLAGQGEFDAVLLDYQMPDSDGAETSVALRRLFSARNPERRVPIFLLTANVFVREQLSSAREAIDAIVQKPLSRHALEELLCTTTPLQQGPLERAVVFELLSTRARTGESMFARLLPRVREQLSQVFGALEHAVAADARTDAARAAHAIAGEAAMIGARKLADEARALEATLADPELPQHVLESALLALKNSHQQANAALSEVHD